MFRKFFGGSEKETPDNRKSQAWNLVSKGIELNEAHRFGEAIIPLTRAITLDSKCADAYANRSIALAAKGMHRQALIDVNKAIKLIKDDKFWHATRAMLSLFTGNWERVISDCVIGLEEKNLPLDFRFAVMGLLIWAKQQKGDNSWTRDVDNYIKLLHILAKTKPELLEVAPLGLIAQQVGLEAVAMTFAYKALDQDNEVDAIVNFTRVIEINPNNSIAYNKRGFLYLKQNNPLAALRDFDNAIAVDVHFTNVYYHRGIAYCLMKNREKAQADFAGFVQLGGDPDMITDKQIFRVIKTIIK